MLTNEKNNGYFKIVFKAVALKALAGVALIGAAAALAANPVLLPVGVLAGRKRRSASGILTPKDLQFPYEFLQQNVPGIDDEATAAEFWNTPKCIARLTCEIQQHYLKMIKNDKSWTQDAPAIKQKIDKEIDQL